jgi:hypothetical protein
MITTISHILGLLGFPSFCTVLAYVYKRLKKNDDETRAVRMGVQAILRSEMISNYRHWSEKGYAPIYAKDNFENCWQQYHMLGQNGVMDDIHNRFMALPIDDGTKVEQY